jgi:hypothetical protein
MLNTFERKILRRIYGPIQEEGRWRLRWNNKLYSLDNGLNIVEDIKIRSVGWAGHIVRMEDGRIPKMGLNGRFHSTNQWEDQESDGRMLFGGIHCRY